MESRGMRGDGLEHEQDYIQERLENASQSDEYAEAARRLEDESRDLQAMMDGRDSGGGEPNVEALENDAQLPVDRMQLRQGGAIGASDSPVDLNQQPPEAEARSRTVAGTGGGATGSS